MVPVQQMAVARMVNKLLGRTSRLPQLRQRCQQHHAPLRLRRPRVSAEPGAALGGSRAVAIHATCGAVFGTTCGADMGVGEPQ